MRHGLNRICVKYSSINNIENLNHCSMPSDIIWVEQSVSFLKAELGRRGLSKTGKKADLVARLSTADSAATEDNSSSGVVWAQQTVSALKTELERRGLPKSGRKAELISRLDAADAGDKADPDLDPGPPPKRQRKDENGASPDHALVGQTARELVQWKDRSRSGEKRARPFVPAPGDEYKKKLKKVQKERMFMLDRTKSVDSGGVVCEMFDIAGSTGNIYQTTIGRSPKCTCMDAVSMLFDININSRLINTNQRIRGQKCKHIYCEIFKSGNYCQTIFPC
jgi:hypothetical protein